MFKILLSIWCKDIILSSVSMYSPHRRLVGAQIPCKNLALAGGRTLLNGSPPPCHGSLLRTSWEPLTMIASNLEES